MRYLASFGLLICFLVPAHLSAGEAKKKSKDPDKDSFITEVGGKTMDQWIKEINHKDPGRRAAAISTVLLFGPDRAYQALDAILEQMSKSVLDVSVRVNGATALGLIIGSARDAETKHIRDAVKILTRLCSDSQAIVKFRAVQALGRIGDEAKSAIPSVMPLLKDNLTCETRQAAATTLGQIAADKEKGPPVFVLTSLFALLDDPAAQVRLAAIQSLTWLGAPADPKVKAQLLAALDHRASTDLEANVRIWANMAVMSVNHDVEPKRVVAILKLFDHPEAPIRIQVAQAIGTIGPKAKMAIPALMNGLTDKDPGVIMVCIWALGRMEDNATMAIPRLEKLSKDADMPEPIQDACKEAIKQISGKKK